MLFKGKLLVSIASIGVVGGTSAGIYYSKIKSEKNEKDDVVVDKVSPVTGSNDVKGDASPDSSSAPASGDVPKDESMDVSPTETENTPPPAPNDAANGKTGSEGLTSQAPADTEAVQSS